LQVASPGAPETPGGAPVERAEAVALKNSNNPAVEMQKWRNIGSSRYRVSVLHRKEVVGQM
jgi:hypothetical protein